MGEPMFRHKHVSFSEKDYKALGAKPPKRYNMQKLHSRGSADSDVQLRFPLFFTVSKRLGFKW